MRIPPRPTASAPLTIGLALLLAPVCSIVAQGASDGARTSVPMYLTVEPASPALGNALGPLDSLVVAPGTRVSIRGVVPRALVGTAVSITVTRGSAPGVTLSARVSETATFQAAYLAGLAGTYTVDAADTAGRVRGTTSFTVQDPADLAPGQEIPFDAVEADAAGLTEIVCQATDILVTRAAELPPSPARDELARRLGAIRDDGRDAIPCGEAPMWVIGVAHANHLMNVAPELRRAVAPLARRIIEWESVAARARTEAPRALADLTHGNVVCDQLDVIVNGLKFLDLYLDLIAKPSEFLQGWAKENIPTKLVGMIPAVGRTPAVKGAIDLGWKGVLSYAPAPPGRTVRTSDVPIDRTLTHAKMINATLSYAGSRVLEAYCERFQGPISGSMTANFFHEGLTWWSYTITIAGQLVLRYPKNATGRVIPLTGELVGNAMKFESHDDAIPVLYPALARGTVFKTIRLEPFAAGMAPLAPNLGLSTPSGFADFNPITSSISQGGLIAQSILTPAFFRVPVRGELSDTELRLELQPAAVDFDDSRVKVIRIMLPVLSMLPEIASYALPYKGARFMMSRAMNDAMATLPVTRRAASMVVENRFDRERSAGDTKAAYHLAVKACNPAC